MTTKGFSSLLNIDSNAKTVKGQKQGYMTAILYLAPHKLANGVDDLCPFSTKGCRQGCLYTAGRGNMSAVQKARIARTKYFLKYRDLFMIDLTIEIQKASLKAERKGLELVVRLNGTSDIDWNFYMRDRRVKDALVQTTIFERFPAIQFYDYTKDQRKFTNNKVPNYHLTLSRDETVEADVYFDALHVTKGNVAVVFDKESYEAMLSGDGWARHIDGDAHDLRFLDEPGKLIVLKAKGKAIKDKHGFVWRGKL